jgi:hypothetical protein
MNWPCSAGKFTAEGPRVQVCQKSGVERRFHSPLRGSAPARYARLRSTAKRMLPLFGVTHAVSIKCHPCGEHAPSVALPLSDKGLDGSAGASPYRAPCFLGRNGSRGRSTLPACNVFAGEMGLDGARPSRPGYHIAGFRPDCLKDRMNAELQTADRVI